MRLLLLLVGGVECSAYGLGFVVLARRFNAGLVTADKKLLKEFPAIATGLPAALAAQSRRLGRGRSPSGLSALPPMVSH